MVADAGMRPELRTRISNWSMPPSLSRNGVNLRLSLSSATIETRLLFAPLLHINGSDLTFTKEADGWNKACLRCAASPFAITYNR